MAGDRYGQLVAEGNVLQDSGDHRGAEQRYLEAVNVADPDDRTSVGMLYINLSNNAQDDGRTDDAVAFARRAIDRLTGGKGEAILQNAHVHFNVANWLLQRDDSASLDFSAKARELYQTYPYTSATDLADCAVLYVLARIFLSSNELKATDIDETWQTISRAPAEAMNRRLLIEFLVNYLSFTRAARPDDFETTMWSIFNWAGKDICEEVYAISQRLQ
jgi:hypothetical protein